MPKGVYPHKKGRVSGFKGKKHSEETKRKMSLDRTGHLVTAETRKKLSLGKKGEKNYSWVGDKIGYSGIHTWIVRTYGPAKDYPCMICAGTNGSKKIDWANISGEYKRDAQDWTTLCRKCHMAFDKHVNFTR